MLDRFVALLGILKAAGVYKFHRPDIFALAGRKTVGD
jgi:hypothetical protein